MKTNFFYSMILVVAFVFVGSTINYSSGQTTTTKTKVEKTTKKTVTKEMGEVYTCKMHPEVVMNKPGKCPKCGMALVEKKEMKKGKMEHKVEYKKDSTKVKKMSM